MMSTQEMSVVEHEHLQALVHRIATHIVEGSAAVHELKSTVARLKNERSDIEYAVYEHWLKAAKTIEAAGKERSSWEKFIKSLRMSYEDDDKETAAASKWEKDSEHLLPIASEELWTHEARNNVDSSAMIINDCDRFVETVVDHGSHDFGKRLSESSGIKLALSEGVVYDKQKLARAAMTVGEPNYKASKGKRKLAEDSASEVGREGETKKRSFIQFTNGRKVGGEKVVALKKGGRCFFCERKGHRAAECKDNPDIQRKPLEIGMRRTCFG